MKKIIITEKQYKFLEENYKITEQTENEKIFSKFINMVKDTTKQKSSPDTSPDTGTTPDTENEDNDDGETIDYDTENLSSTGDKFMDVTRKVIEKFEGGYWNPICAKYPGTRHPPKTGAYKDSGETMYGLDRVAGNIENLSSEGKEFFTLIDKEKQKLGEETFCRTWIWNYIPPEPLKSKLINLASATMKKGYNNNEKYFFKGNTKKVVDSSRALLLHFSYATWNGPWFFQQFANTINKGVAEGKPIKSLIELAKQDRLKYMTGYWAEGAKRVNAAIDEEAAIDNAS